MPVCRRAGYWSGWTAWTPSAPKREWAAAREESRRTFSLAGLYEVLEEWQGRLASAPAVDAFVASGYDDSEFIDMADLCGRRRCPILPMQPRPRT
ncbi:hypothetical protein SUDANB15_07423 (plasmid) [Streptomyces sp. enrichment culture]